MNAGFFQIDGGPEHEILVPQESACSQWGSGESAQVRGMAVSGALARAVEREVQDVDGGTDLHPARWTLDLFRPTAMRPLVIAATVIRRGRRLCLIDAILTQQDVPVARASALFLATGGKAAGETWSAPADTYPPPPDMRPDTVEPRLYYSEGVGWTGSPDAHGNSSRKQTWHFPDPVVTGEPPSAFQQVAMVADAVNVVANWGDAGVQFINTDLTLALARLPHGDELGLVADQRLEADGVVVATALMFDRSGTLGSVTITAIANGDNAVDPRLFRTHV